MARVDTSGLRAAKFALKEPLQGCHYRSTRAMRFQRWYEQSVYRSCTSAAALRQAWRKWQEEMSRVPLEGGYTSH